jgi:transcriptional regulator with XRE-family HTH domain
MSARGDFGAELRRRRLLARISLAGLSARLHYSKGYLSKIENRQQAPTEKLARLADAELGGDGELVKLFFAGERVSDEHQAASSLSQPASSSFLIPVSLQKPDLRAAAEDTGLDHHYWTLFQHYRRSGQQHAPAIVLRGIRTELYTLRELAEAARDPGRRIELANLAARYAEYAGWMAQETGAPDDALAWTRMSAEIADEHGHAGLAAYSLVREAELAMYAHDGRRTVALAQQAALHPGADARVRGLAAHRQAQGHALLGDYRECHVELDRANQLLSEPTDGTALGSTTVTDLGTAVAGWCLYDLGRPREAAEELERVVRRTAPDARRARAMYGARLALACEAANEFDRMCHTTRQVLSDAATISSATVQAQLRELARAVARRHNHGAARELHAEIMAALSTLD